MTEGEPILTAAEMHGAETAAGVPLFVLMERAGAAIAELAWRVAAGAPVLILCGPGNNGGDGYVAAQVLKGRGATVRVAATGEPTAALAAGARAGWRDPVEALEEAEPAPVVVDALFGSGLNRGLEPEVAGALARLAGPARHRVAVDLPSGVEVDTGALLSAVPSMTATLALGARKPAHFLEPAASLMGQVLLADLGLTIGEASLRSLARPHLPAPREADHKYTRGLVEMVGGAMPGAAALAALAAARAGAGYVRLAVDRALPGLPLAVVQRAEWTADRLAGALLIGPGLGRDDAARAQLGHALSAGRPLVLDGDALHLVAPRELHGRDVILTPHAGEFDAMFGIGSGSKLRRTRDAARTAGAVVVHKGPDTVIAAPDGRAALARPSPWLATAGTGDVLAGAIAAMRARGLAPFEAARAGVWLHAEAARRAGPGLIADDLISELRAAAVACS